MKSIFQKGFQKYHPLDFCPPQKMRIILDPFNFRQWIRFWSFHPLQWICAFPSQVYKRLTGDVLLSSGVVAYLGAFTVDFRNDCIAEWVKICQREKITCSENFSLNHTLGEPVKIRDWQIAGQTLIRKKFFNLDENLVDICFLF